MKNYLSKCSDLKKMILLASVIGLVLILASIAGAVFGQFGWMVGVALGTVVEIINLFLLFKSSEIALKETKSSLFLLLYFVRMLLYVAGILVLVLLQFFWHISFFDNSFWGFIIGISPMQIVVIIVMAKSGKGPLEIAEKKEEK